ncbi:MAG: long-chain fatty acid--CoA ligase [Cyanobacteria bacterium M5B4]|nr:MAG: long-chain fatty acid--CoA ligase [Cyanobacteria bacterium M5B4]
MEIRPSASNDWQLFQQLVPYGRRYLRDFRLSLGLLVPIALVEAIQPVIVQQAIDGPIQSGDQVWFYQICLVFFLSVVVRLVFTGVQGYLVQKVGQRITADIRQDLFHHVTSLSTSFFDRMPVGKLITRLTGDVEALGDVFATGAVGIFSDVAIIIVTIVVMLLLRWDLALLLISLIFPVAGLIIYFQLQYRSANFKAREHLSELNSILQENIIGINVVQLFRREDYNRRYHEQVNQRYNQEINKTIFHESAVSATLEWISLIGIAGVLWLGSRQILSRVMTFGELSAFILFAERLFTPLRQLAEKFTVIQSGFTAIERIHLIMSEPIDIRDPIHPVSLPVEGRGEIRFEDVSFAYKPGEYVLKNLNFTIAPGEKVALIGPTGSGKSSIVRLLSRLYEPTQGRILIDGVDIRHLTQRELRTYVGVILQDPFLFSGDVTTNITLGDDYSLAEVEEACRQMNVDRFIQDLPRGYFTEVRARGTNLSAGQKQLLAFARSAVRHPRVLILDEATASLDVGTEFLIQKALTELLQDRTAIIIAHRLSTVRHVDRVLVLKRGELIEMGTQAELLAKGGYLPAFIN